MDSTDGTLIKKTFVINITWTIVLLSLTIISLLACIIAKIQPEAEGIKKFIDYAATLLSITLSIFAIAFTYTSNNTIQRQFDKIDSASNAIKASSQSLQTSEKDLTLLIQQLHDRIKHIETEIGVIKENISNNIPKISSNFQGTQQNLITK